MGPRQFLQKLWPAEGIYCLATPARTPEGRAYYRHTICPTIADAALAVDRAGDLVDLYFAVHSLKEAKVWNEAKQKYEVRVQRNSCAARCFFFDLDVGDAAGKYASQAAALTDLKTFCASTGLPKPLITSSGGGLHVYWPLTDDILTDAWRPAAAKLKQLAQHYGLRVDPMRTTDSASVLRVAGTWNLKDKSNKRQVQLLADGAATRNHLLISIIDKAVITAGITPKQPVTFDPLGLGSNTSAIEYDGPPVAAKAVIAACPQIQRFARLRGDVSEPEWYHGIVGVMRFTESGNRAVHKMSSGHKDYTLASCDTKIIQHEGRTDHEGNRLGPTSCAQIAAVSGVGDEPCQGCRFAGKVKNPIMAARYRDPAPAPILTQYINEVVHQTEIPDPPAPFLRMKGGGVAYSGKNKDGEAVDVKIFDYDLYPIRRLTNPQMGTEQHMWHVELPREGGKDFMLDADALYDPRKFVVAISNQGLYPVKANIPYLQDYMVAYISQLQKLADAEAQCNHLGWTDERKGFVMPDKILRSDGPARPAMLSLGAQRAAANIHKRGTLEKQVELLRFYEHPDYVAHRAFILAGLAAPLFHMTGHHGVVVNASGPPGASKSTALYTAASFWGHPVLYPINGTNSGATTRGRNERVTTLANLPICVDEITHIPQKEAADLAMGVTQPGHRIRLGSDGVERASAESHKATIMMTTANSSLHALLSADNSAGTAGSMRVFEINFEAQHIHQKFEADEYLADLKENFGHIGELFIAYVMQHYAAVEARVRAMMKAIDISCRIEASERFWSAYIAPVLVTGEIIKELLGLDYAPAQIRRWLMTKQLPVMRSTVTSEYSTPISTLTDYLAQISGNTIITHKSEWTSGAPTVIDKRPTGALLAHYDRDAETLYVLKKAFKEYCSRMGANSTQIIRTLSQFSALPSGRMAQIITQDNIKVTLGARTEFAISQAYCLRVDMSNPDVAGTIQFDVIEGGVAKAANEA